MNEHVRPDFMYQFHLFEVDETVVFIQAVRTIDYAFRKKNRVSYTIQKGTKAIIVDVKKADSCLISVALSIANYKVRTEDGKVIDCIPEYVLEPK